MSVWDDIKERLSVEEVIADYIPMVSAGSNFKAVCPFHQEKSPSLMISPSKGIWHCFGCGEGGDIFAFVAQIESLNKQETLQRLAKKASIDLKSYEFHKNSHNTLGQFSGHQEEQKTTIAPTSDHEYGLKLLSWSADIYHKILLKILENHKHPVTIYCRQRQLSEEIINTFQIGYAPRATTIRTLAQKHTLNQDILLAAGILKQTEKNGHIDVTDKFKDRLMIPILSSDQTIVGFTGRVLPYDKYERPKYLNSSQSEWFNKSDLWFGLNHAKPSIIRQKNAIIVEGNMDVVSCHQAGLTTAIASQGTSFTDNQLKILKRLTRRVSLAFDNDEAGILAGKKFFMQATILGITVDRVVIPAQFKDIDEYISSAIGSDESQSLNIEVTPFFQWYVTVMNHRLVHQDMHVQHSAIEDCILVINVMDPLSQEQSLKLLSETTSLSRSTLQSLLKPLKSHSMLPQSHVIEEELQQVKMNQRPLVNSWKNFLATHMNTAGSEHLLSQLYFLLRDVFPVVGSYETLTEYVAAHSGELDYINQELRGTGDDNGKQIQSQLILELDREIYVLTLKPEILENYITIKKLLN